MRALALLEAARCARFARAAGQLALPAALALPPWLSASLLPRASDSWALLSPLLLSPISLPVPPLPSGSVFIYQALLIRSTSPIASLLISVPSCPSPFARHVCIMW